eukprot:TRINITY_DN8448_c1_g1_i1.p1 TRINITY_DN8448_c1_g1~~TRINITY_DN8448_c1_g1_i1.p1  ORF type:complete len:157 (-),score=18.01 TRINITY_DN8448_c1_g1_i1:42-512(-)
MADHFRSFQKQDQIFLAKKRVVGRKLRSSDFRSVKSVGLGFRTPREAITGTYIDKKCPWTGNVSIRGRVLKGVVKSTKMQRTVIIRRNYLHYIRKYKRYEKRHKNLAAHISPALTANEGDLVTIGECRPLAKTVRFNVLRIDVAAAKKSGKQFKKI